MRPPWGSGPPPATCPNLSAAPPGRLTVPDPPPFSNLTDMMALSPPSPSMLPLPSLLFMLSLMSHSYLSSPLSSSSLSSQLSIPYPSSPSSQSYLLSMLSLLSLSSLLYMLSLSYPPPPPSPWAPASSSVVSFSVATAFRTSCRHFRRCYTFILEGPPYQLDLSLYTVNSISSSGGTKSSTGKGSMYMVMFSPKGGTRQ